MYDLVWLKLHYFVGIIWFVFHALQIHPIGFTQTILFSISKPTMNHQP